MSRSVWEILRIFIHSVVPEKQHLPGVVIAVQTFGYILGFNPHNLL